MGAVQTISKPQPQVAQLELLFDGPLIKDSMVELHKDLQYLSKKYHYPQKQIWVKEHGCIYYLEKGDGSDIKNWKKMQTRVVIEKYNPELKYYNGETCYLSGKIYVALNEVPFNYSPLDYEDYWLCISGQTETYRYIFRLSAHVRIFTEIRNPTFEILTGEFQYDEDGFPIMDNKGFIKMLNQEIIEGYVVKPDNIEPNSGIAYDIYFYSNIGSKNLSGVINVK